MLSDRTKSAGGWIVFGIIGATWLAVVCTIAVVAIHFVVKYW